MLPDYYLGPLSQNDLLKIKTQLTKFADSFLIILNDGPNKYLILAAWHTRRGFRIVSMDTLFKSVEDHADIPSEDLFGVVINHIHEMYTSNGPLTGSLRIKEEYAPWGNLIYSDIINISHTIWK